MRFLHICALCTQHYMLMYNVDFDMYISAMNKNIYSKISSESRSITGVDSGYTHIITFGD